MLNGIAATVAAIDWGTNGPWLVLLLSLLAGIALPAGLYALFDHWAARRLRIDTIALATRYGGFMNSWAVFGRHASEYRDLRPLFPSAQAAELARFSDGTACIAARFRSEAAAQEAAVQRFASFAAAGVEYADAGVSFQTAKENRGGEKGYARGQWLVIGDTIFAFYGADSAALARRRQATPALRARRFPGPLRLLHGRSGHGVVAALWLVVVLALAGQWIERSVAIAGEGAPLPAGELRLRLIGLDSSSLRLSALRQPEGLIIAGRADDLLQKDLDLLAGRDWITGFDLVLDTERSVVKALPIIGRSNVAARLGEAPPPPARWRNNALLVEGDDPLLQAVRDTVLQAGWEWQPVLWPAGLRLQGSGLQWAWPRFGG